MQNKTTQPMAVPPGCGPTDNYYSQYTGDEIEATVQRSLKNEADITNINTDTTMHTLI